MPTNTHLSLQHPVDHTIQLTEPDSIGPFLSKANHRPKNSSLANIEKKNTLMVANTVDLSTMISEMVREHFTTKMEGITLASGKIMQ